ncbi:alpha/beta hydrolase [Nocardia sp. NPDC051990]|uniref:alpha/beta hydrolase n=1 Tax=Nocardia sp. NPDC051990 TaxID=3155285 RepID=UPI003432B3C0
MSVPIDWSRPEGASIDVAVVRDQADEPAHKVGTLISLAGGPGTSGVDEIMRGDKFSAELRARFDIVGFDPRGVRRSHPLQCDAGLAMTRPGMVPDTGAKLDEVRSYTRKLADTCRRYTGPLIDHLDSMSVARDIEAIRAALGVDQISVYSRSYGTLAAQAYAESFPQRLRASVLDSVDDHSLDGAAFMASEARAGEDTFTEFASWCARDEQCVLHDADVRGTYGELYDRAARGELRDPIAPDKPLGPLELSMKVTHRLYRPEWSRLATELHALLDQPTGTPIQPPPPTLRGEPTPMAELIVCFDWNFDIHDQRDWLRLWREQNDNAPTLRAHFAWGAGSICSGWPSEPANPPHPPANQSGPPILILTSRHDPATPNEWARQVAAQTHRATLLTYAGWGHGIYDRTPCTTNATDRYLIDGTIPAPVSCPAT